MLAWTHSLSTASQHPALSFLLWTQSALYILCRCMPLVAPLASVVGHHKAAKAQLATQQASEEGLAGAAWGAVHCGSRKGNQRGRGERQRVLVQAAECTSGVRRASVPTARRPAAAAIRPPQPACAPFGACLH